MLILTIRTDNPQAEIGLFDGHKQLAYERWQAHRQLAETIHQKLSDILKSNKKDWPDLEGIVCFKGPGSFTGLRIGLTVADTLAYSLGIPIIGSEGGEWTTTGINQLNTGHDQKTVVPEYGADAHITKPRK